MVPPFVFLDTMQGNLSMGFIKFLLLLPAVAYLGLALFALLFANRLVFPAPPSGYADSPAIEKFAYGKDGASVSMVYLEHPGSQFLVFYHHGNGEDLESILPRLEALRRSGLSVLAWDYPGYGTSEGRPSEKLVLKIATGIMDTIPDKYGYAPSQIILYGRSVGSGPAIWLANREQTAGLILEGAFTSIFRVATRIPLLPWDIFDNLSRIESIQCPLLCLHGTSDQTVPFEHGRTLFERAPGEKFFAWFDSGRHNNLITDYPDTYASSIRRFLEHLDGDAAPAALLN